MRRKNIGLMLLTVGCIVLFSGCSAESRQKWLSTFFDGTDSPPPPTTRVRRDLLQEIEELKRKLAEAEREKAAAVEAAKAGKKSARTPPPIEQAKSWEEAAELLPKDGAGHVDWLQALKARTIRPRPGIDPQAAEQAVLEMDVELASSANKLFRVIFPHAAHTRWLTCSNCHPAIFPLRQAKPTVVTMAKVRAGGYCGVCHGKVAFGIDGECPRCHAKAQPTAEWHPPEPRKPIETAKNWDEAAKLLPVTQGVIDWARALTDGIIAPRAGIDPKTADQPVLPLDVELVPAAGQMFKVIFPHKTHTEWLACTNCHTGIFQMAKGADPITMEKINGGSYCGVCHGKVAFPPTACARCHPAMGGGK